MKSFRKVLRFILILSLLVGHGQLYGIGDKSIAFAEKTSDVVISQIYGGAATEGALYNTDFIEFFNTSNEEVSLNGWKIFYQAPGGTGNFIKKYEFGNVSIKPHRYFLLAGATQKYGENLPLTADAMASVDLAGFSGGKLLLTDNKVPDNLSYMQLSNGTVSIIDGIGYKESGSNIGYPLNWSEGSSPAPTMSLTTGLIRRVSYGNAITSPSAINFGSDFDTNNNGNDFTLCTAPFPRNSATQIAEAYSSNLERLDIGGNPTNYNFANNQYTYKGICLSTSASSINVVASGAGVITINGIVTESGKPSQPVAISTSGPSIILVTVQEPNKAPRVYNLEVTNLFSTEPLLKIDTDKKVKLGDSFEVYISAENFKSIYAEDFSMIYDTSAFELIEVKDLSENQFVYHKKLLNNGFRVILASEDASKGINGSEMLFKLKFKAIKAIKGKITLSNGLIADHNGNELLPKLEGSIINVYTVNADVNGDGRYSLGDLAISAFNKGKVVTQWSTPKADVDMSEIIDKTDLQLIVEKILENE